MTANLGAGTITVTTGTVTLNGTEAATTVNINSGTLTLGANDRLIDTVAVTIAGGTLDLNNKSDTIGTLTFNSGVLQSTGGTQTLTLAGSTATTLQMQGNTTIPASVNVALSSTTLSGVGMTFDPASGGTAMLNGNLDLNSTATAGVTRTFTISDGSAPTDVQIAGIITNTTSTALTKAGAGTLTLTNGTTNTFTGGVYLSAGTLAIWEGNSLGALPGSPTVNLTVTGTSTLQFAHQPVSDVLANRSFLINSGVTLTIDTQSYSEAIQGVISGASGALRKVGTGLLTLNGVDTYTGATTIDAGTLKLGVAGALGNGTNNTSGVTVSATGAALDLNGFTPTANVGLTLNGTGIASGGALTNSGGTATYGGLLTLGSASSIVSNSGNIVLSNTGTITGATFGLTLDGTASGSSVASIIGTTSGSLTKAGTGTWTLSGASTFTGGTTVNNGTLALSGGSTNNIASSATIDLQTDATRVLDVTGLSGGTLVLASGQTLKGKGTVSGKLTAADGSAISPGAADAGTGVLATGDLTLSATSSVTFDVNGYTTADTDFDQLSVAGAVAINNANVTFQGTTATPPTSTTIKLIDNNGTGDAVTGTYFNGYPQGAAVSFGNFSGVINYFGGDGNDVVIQTVGPISYTLPAAGAYKMRLNTTANTLEILDSGNNVLQSTPVGAVTSVTIDGSSSDDVFNVDFANGNPIPAGGLTFNGLGTSTATGDTLNVINNATAFSSFTVNHTGTDTNGFSGDISIDDGNVIRGIHFTGLSPINAGNATDIIFHLTVGDDNATLADAGSGKFTLSAPGFESTTMNYPLSGGSLQIYMDTGNDTLTVTSLALLANTNLTIDGEGGPTDTDTINLNAAGGFTVTKNLTLKAETIAQSGPVTVTGTTTLDAGAGTITLTANNVFGGSVSIINAASAQLTDTNGIDVSGASLTGSLSLTAGGVITDSGAITGTTLTTSSVGGTVLDFGDTVSTFNATNTGSGNIQLTNTAGTLTVTGISQAGGGNVTVGNTGQLTTSGAISTAANGTISLTATGNTLTLGSTVTAGGSGTVTLAATGATSDILVTATVSSTSGAIGATAGRNVTLSTGDVTTSGNVTLTGTAGTVSETGAGKISGGLLTTSSVGGTTLNAANTVTSFHATNITSGNVQLINSGALDITGISQTGGGNVIVTITGAGTLTASGAITSNGGNVTLTSQDAMAV
ncbi:MAG: autotransporter-associated beta strand repeat-containing protein, partial [Planctomycetota bacterium]|nr:autotransporter-associated beta strand repeat-containing protein [Planctomycetota bacterium]